MDQLVKKVKVVAKGGNFKFQLFLAPGGIIESMICAGQAQRDSCSGDSGGKTKNLRKYRQGGRKISKFEPVDGRHLKWF